MSGAVPGRRLGTGGGCVAGVRAGVIWCASWAIAVLSWVLAIVLIAVNVVGTLAVMPLRVVWPSRFGRARRHRVVVVGGGFVGAFVARKLQRQCLVTLVDDKDYFEFTPSVPRTLVSPEHVGRIQMAHTEYLDVDLVEVVQGHVVGMHLEAASTSEAGGQGREEEDDDVRARARARAAAVGAVELGSGQQIPFDFVVLCTGSTYNLPFKEHARTVAATRASHIAACHAHLAASDATLVVGGGIVGVEAAAELADTYGARMALTLAHSGARLMHGSSGTPRGASGRALAFLERRGVEVRLGERVHQVAREGRAAAEEAGDDGSATGGATVGAAFVGTESGHRLEPDMALVCTGICPNTGFLRGSPLASSLDARGFVQTSPTLQVGGHACVFAAGDLVAAPPAAGRDPEVCTDRLAQIAEWMAEVVTHNVSLLDRWACSHPELDLRACVRGSPQHAGLPHLHQFAYPRHTPPMLISLGKYDALLVWRGWCLGGVLPAIMKEFVEVVSMTLYRWRPDFWV